MSEIEVSSAGNPAERDDEELRPEEEPVVTGTLFLMLLFLMMIFGFWAMMYLIMLNR